MNLPFLLLSVTLSVANPARSQKTRERVDVVNKGQSLGQKAAWTEKNRQEIWRDAEEIQQSFSIVGSNPIYTKFLHQVIGRLKTAEAGSYTTIIKNIICVTGLVNHSICCLTVTVT